MNLEFGLNFIISLTRRSQSLRATSYGSSDRLHGEGSKQRKLGKLIGKLDNSNESNFDAERKGKQTKKISEGKNFLFFVSSNYLFKYDADGWADYLQSEVYMLRL